MFPWDCEVCTALGVEKTGSARYPGDDEAVDHLPGAYRRLVHVGSLLRCPLCATFYELTRSFDADPGGGVEDVTLLQLTPAEAINKLKDPALIAECTRLLAKLDEARRSNPAAAARWLIHDRARKNAWPEIEAIVRDPVTRTAAAGVLGELARAGMMIPGHTQLVLAEQLVPVSRAESRPALWIYEALDRVATTKEFGTAAPAIIAALDHEHAQRDAARLLESHFKPRLARARRSKSIAKQRRTATVAKELLDAIPVLVRHVASPITFAEYEPSTGKAARYVLRTLAAESAAAAKRIPAKLLER